MKLRPTATETILINGTNNSEESTKISLKRDQNKGKRENILTLYVLNFLEGA